MKLSDIEEMDNLLSDPLFRFISMNEKLKDSLEPSFLEELEFNRSYATSDAARFLNKSDSNLRYYLRELDSYIQAPRFGRNYKLEAIHIYRLYLILLLMGEGMSVQDIAIMVGQNGDISTNIPSNSLSTNEKELISHQLIKLNEQQEQMAHLFLQQNQFIYSYIHKEKQSQELQNKLFQIDLEKSKKEEELKRTRLELRHQKQTDQFLNVIRDRMNTKVGFFSQLFRKQNNDDVELHSYSNEDVEVEPIIQEIEQTIKKLDEERNEVLKEIEKVQSSLNTQLENIAKLTEHSATTVIQLEDKEEDE